MDQTMPKANIRLVVMPDEVDQQIVAGCDPTVVGTEFATCKQLKVTRVVDGYAILYRASEFTKINAEIGARNITNILLGYFPNFQVVLSIYYNFQHISNPDIGKFDEETAIRVLQFANYFFEHNGDNENFKYVNSDSIRRVRDILYEMSDEEEDDPADNDETDDDHNGYWESLGFSSMYGGDEYDDDGHPKKKKGKKHYGRSRLVSNGKSPKKDYNRHGVLVSRDSDDLSRDRKMIKAFLKDFIPGNARWKRDFRDDLLERWMDAFVIRKKKLRKLEKKMRRKKKNSKPSAAQAIAMGIGRQIMTGQDPWNNHNK